MPRVVGVDIPSNKPTWISLTYLYGIGRHQSKRILEACGIDGQKRAQDLTEEEVARIAGEIDTSDPGAVSNLGGAVQYPSTVVFFWTAQGDDGSGPRTARMHELRYSTLAITDESSTPDGSSMTAEMRTMSPTISPGVGVVAVMVGPSSSMTNTM